MTLTVVIVNTHARIWKPGGFLPERHHVIAEESARQQRQFRFPGSCFESTHETLEQQHVHAFCKQPTMPARYIGQCQLCGNKSKFTGN